MTTNNEINDEEESEIGLDEEQIQEDDLVGLDEKDEKCLFVEKRLKNLIKAVADHDKFEDIRFGKTGLKTLQESFRFISVMLTYEMIESLKKKQRKTISPGVVNEALASMLGKSDSLGIAVNELEKLIGKLESLNDSTSITKAMDYVNVVERLASEDKNQ